MCRPSADHPSLFINCLGMIAVLAQGSVWKDWVKSVVIGSHGDLGDPAFHPQEAVMGFPVIIES